jgi:hypothetical protein
MNAMAILPIVCISNPFVIYKIMELCSPSFEFK